MADKESTGAVHLTTLDLDVSKIFEQLNEINQKVQETAEQVRNTQFTIGGSVKNTQNPLGDMPKKTEQAVSTTKAAIESLNLAYKNFQNTLAKSKLDDAIGTPLSKIKGDVDANAKSIRSLTSAVQDGEPITKEMAENYKALASALKTSKGELKDAETNAIKTGKGFKALGDNARNAGSSISDLLTRLADKAKWMLAFQLVSLVQNAFSNIIGTIKQTEDSVVELQRVLNENIAAGEISKELYNIGYEFGRSFEDVQEVAVKFAQTGKSWQEVIEATRATMLGLNTAELEVSTATEGLIAVMAQFELDASELESVIDKINITADSFPVTSEKIVAALQRAGGTASAFNMTLEQTIATITALAEQTGRSGENIGTALNSLIIFTSKSENLKLFSTLSEQMDETVKKFQAGSNSIIDVWTQLSKEVENLSKQQEDALFGSTAFEEFADQFEAEAAEYAADIQKIYGTAGAYRRNYLTAILNDMSTVEKALANMTDAEGYSLQENEKYMETLTAHVEQLKTVANELAVQFGEKGFLDFAKGLVDVITLALRLTQAFGGLHTVFIALSAAIFAVKVDKISSFFFNSINNVKSLGNAFQNLLSQMNPLITYQNAYNKSLADTAKKAAEAATETEREAIAAQAAAKATAAGISAMMGSLLIIGTVISMISGLYDRYVQKLEEAKQKEIELRNENIRLGNEAEESAKNIFGVYGEYLEQLEKDVDGTSSQLSKAQKAVLQALGYDDSSIEKLKGQYEDLDSAIQRLIETEYDQIKVLYEAQKVAAEEKWKEIEAPLATTSDQIAEYLKDLRENFSVSADVADEFKNILENVPSNTEDAGKAIELLNRVIDDFKGQSDDASKSPFFQALVNYRSDLQDFIDGVEDANDQLETLGKTAEEAGKNYSEQAKSAKDATDGLAESFNALDLEALSKAFDTLSGKVDSFQSAYSSILDIIDEYNKTGTMSVDNLQTLLGMEPEYIGLIEEKNGKLSINKERLDDLIAANNDYLLQMEAIQIAEQVNIQLDEIKKTTTENMTVAEINAALATKMLGDDVTQAAYAFLKGEDDGTRFRKAVEDLGKQAEITSNQMSVLSTNAWNALSTLAGLFSMKSSEDSSGGAIDPSEFGIKNYYTTSAKSKSSTKSAFEKEKEAFDELLKQYEHEIYLMEKRGEEAEKIANKYVEMQNLVHQRADKLRKQGYTDESEVIRNLQKQWWQYADERVKAYKEATDKILDITEHEIFLIEKNNASFVIPKQEIPNDFIDALDKQAKEIVQDYNDILDEVNAKQIDLSRTVYGNIDTNNRQILEWTEENIEKYRDALESWNQSAEEMLGSFSTVLGSSSEFDGVEIAFSPILQTEDGPVLLSRETVTKYIFGLINKVGENWHSEDLLRLDTEGLEIDGKKIKNLLAGIGEEAIKIGEAMHYTGNLGAVADAYNEVKAYADAAGMSVEEFAKKFKELENVAASSKKEILESQSELARTLKYEAIIAKYKQMQDEVHKLAEQYRAMGLDDTSEYIRELQKKWWQYQEAIEEVARDIYESNVEAFNNAISQLEFEYGQLERLMDYSGMENNLDKQLEYFKKIRQASMDEYERLIAEGKDINNEMVQSTIKTFNDATEQIQALSKQIADNILSIYDDFISLADSLNVWDKLNFTKLDYLKDKLKEINNLYKEGKLSLAEYKDLLEDTGIAIYNARKEELEKQKKDIKDHYDDLIDGYKEQINLIKKQKSDSDKYYDGLIKQLRDVEESNDRINAQLDYYANRQKILRNIEQAQARSGVEWREKEIQYQEELSKLDEDWRRQQEEWNIADQIEELEKLKQAAADQFEASIARIEDYIKNAEKASEAAIENISDQIDEIGKKIFDYIQETVKQANEAAQMKDVVPTIQNTMTELQKTIRSGWEALTNDIAKLIKNSIADGANAGIADMQTTLGKALATMQNSINTVMQKTISTANMASNSNIKPSNSKTTVGNAMQAAAGVVNVVANVANPSTANSLVNALSKILTNPSRF